jgi:UDP-N-acetylglucosamine 2-epimerase
MKIILTVLGTRPQYLKYAAIAAHSPLPFRNILVDTGQHYDAALSAAFFHEYRLEQPDVTLEVERSEGMARLSALLAQLDPLYRKYRPDAMLCFGDTDSTLAAALTASRNGVPIFHVEAGERSRDRSGARIHPADAPEEANRVTVDHLSSLLLCATDEAVENLEAERVCGETRHTGDIMFDLFLRAHDAIPTPAAIRKKYGLAGEEYVLCTLHRAINTDDAARLRSLIDTMNDFPCPVFLPLHPRTAARMKAAGISPAPGSLQLLPPIPHHDVLGLLKGARRVMTDSGGLTREAYFSAVPSICLDDATAWHRLCESGWCSMTGCDPQAIRDALAAEPEGPADASVFGEGMAAVRVIEEMSRFLR